MSSFFLHISLSLDQSLVISVSVSLYLYIYLSLHSCLSVQKTVPPTCCHWFAVSYNKCFWIIFSESQPDLILWNLCLCISTSESQSVKSLAVNHYLWITIPVYQYMYSKYLSLLTVHICWFLAFILLYYAVQYFHFCHFHLFFAFLLSS